MSIAFDPQLLESSIMKEIVLCIEIKLLSFSIHFDGSKVKVPKTLESYFMEVLWPSLTFVLMKISFRYFKFEKGFVSKEESPASSMRHIYQHLVHGKHYFPLPGAPDEMKRANKECKFRIVYLCDFLTYKRVDKHVERDENRKKN
jgi:hypothetical protein